MKLALVSLFVMIAAPLSSMAHGDDLVAACKAECPSAKTEDEAHACLKSVVATKKKDAKWKSSACAKALKEHEAHEKKSGHSDDHSGHDH